MSYSVEMAGDFRGPRGDSSWVVTHLLGGDVHGGGSALGDDGLRDGRGDGRGSLWHELLQLVGGHRRLGDCVRGHDVLAGLGHCRAVRHDQLRVRHLLGPLHDGGRRVGRRLVHDALGGGHRRWGRRRRQGRRDITGLTNTQHKSATKLYAMKNSYPLEGYETYYQSKGIDQFWPCNKAVANVFPHKAEPSSATTPGQYLLD